MAVCREQVSDPSILATSTKWLLDKLLPPALLAVAVSWAIPRALDKSKGRREHFYKTVDTLRQQLEALQPIAAAYWFKKHDGKSAAVEETIKFLLGDIGKLMRLASDAGAPSLYSSPESKGVQGMAELIDATTGGDFGSSKRLAEPERSARITRASVHLLSLLADARWQVVNTGARVRRG
ncbi:hypothetical protein GCM10009101_18900 [Brevundimonas lenta]